MKQGTKIVNLVFNEPLVVLDPEETDRLKYAIHDPKKLKGGGEESLMNN